MDFNRPHIYRRKILFTGKFYIGKHKGGDKYYKGSGKDWKIDLKLYKEYESEILEYVDDILELNKREIYWLEKFDAANNPLYYNKTNKSFGPNSQTLEWKINKSEMMKGKSTTQGKTWKVKDTSNMKGGGTLDKTWKWDNSSTEERNLKISNSMKGRDISLWKDKIYTEERNLKISLSNGEKIFQLDLENKLIKIWNSQSELKKSGFPGIQGALKRDKSYKGFIWKREKYI